MRNLRGLGRPIESVYDQAALLDRADRIERDDPPSELIREMEGGPGRVQQEQQVVGAVLTEKVVVGVHVLHFVDVS